MMLHEIEPIRSPTESLRQLIDGGRLRMALQPIVDLYARAPIGYEMLARGEASLESPDKLFQVATESDMLWELEQACHRSALETIASLSESDRSSKFFLNVSGAFLGDPQFLESFTSSLARESGLELENIVLEITERDNIVDTALFETALQRLVGQGYKIALDDFGSGHSGLLSLITCRPNFLKLDKAIVRDVHRTHYQQLLVRSLVNFAESVNSKLIAEGVETWDELEAILRLGVRYVQGFLFAKPQFGAAKMTDETRNRLTQAVRKNSFGHGDLDETINNLVLHNTTVVRGDLTTEVADRLFRQNQDLDHVVISHDSQPVHLITRRHFYWKTGGPFGYSLFAKKSAKLVAKRNPMVVENRMRVTTLAKLAMERDPEDLYDPVLVVDGDGRLLGTVTMKQLIHRSIELEVGAAQGSNPLTGLPGNRKIQKWIREALERPQFTVIYADLDRFKEYNDAYGFLAGDDMLRLASQVLSRGLANISSEALLGHIGGDDFVIVCPGLVEPGAMRRICENFDNEKLELFSNRDQQRGYYYAMNRNDEFLRVPLVTMSLAVVDSEKLEPHTHPAVLSQVAASLKKIVKEATLASSRSDFLFERRFQKHV